MASKDELLNHLIGIKEDLSELKSFAAATNEHLIALNSKVARNVLLIDKNREDIDNTKLSLARYGGAIAFAIIGIQLLIRFIL